MSLLDQTYKDEINTAMGQIFDTFANIAPFKFYKPNIEEIIIFDNDYNADLQEGVNNPNAILTEQYSEFRCRIIYPRRESTWENHIAGGANVAVKGEQDVGIIYLQFLEEANEYLKDSIRFTFMGDKYQKLTSPRKIGVLDTYNVYSITLKKVN